MSKRKSNQNPSLVVMISLGVLLLGLSILGVFDQAMGIGLQIRQQVTSPVSVVSSSVNQMVSIFSGMQMIQLENQELKQQILEYAELETKHAELAEQNKFLLQQVNAEIPAEIPMIVSEVIKYEYAPAAGFIYISIGDADVKKGDWAVVSNYIVGQVTETMGQYAKVALLLASQTSLPVEIGTAREVGLLVGNTGLEMSVQDVSPTHKIVIGDEIRPINRSGIDSEGLLIGKVVGFEGDEADSTFSVEIESPINFQSLEYVLLVKQHE